MQPDPLSICRVENLEIATFDFALVVSVLVNCAGIIPSEPYVIDDLKRGLRIRTNALTHLLARWDKNNNSICRSMVLRALLMYGADATAPYEVTPLFEGRAISTKQGVLRAASGQSLMAFQMSMHLKVPPTI